MEEQDREKQTVTTLRIRRVKHGHKSDFKPPKRGKEENNA